MKLKKVVTVIPACSLGETLICNKDCKICDKASYDKVSTVMVPENQSNFISISASKDTVSNGETVDIVCVFDGPISIDDIIESQPSGMIVLNRMRISDDSICIRYKCTELNICKKNIVITYKGISRCVIINVEIHKAILESFHVSDNTIKIGDVIRLDLNLNRTLRENEPLPTVKYDSNAFELIQELQPSKTMPENIFCLLQAKIDKGFYGIDAYISDNDIKTEYVTISPQDLIYATEEDIDYLFPELRTKQK